MIVKNCKISDEAESVEIKTELPTMEIGDIVLLRTDNEKFSWTSSKTIRGLQNTFSAFKQKANYSHAALCIDHGLFIEAKGKEFVVYSTYEDLFKTKSGERCATHFRNKNLNNNGKLRISERGLYYAGTPYSNIFGQLADYISSILPFRAHTQYRAHSVEDEYGSFCSSLVVDILNPIKDKDSDLMLAIEKNSKYILPLHLEQLMAEDDRWYCVDDVYEQLQGNSERAEAYRKLGKIHQYYYKEKQEALKTARDFFTIKDYYQTVPLWFRMHIYHLLKKGTANGEVKEYWALKSLAELLEREK